MMWGWAPWWHWAWMTLGWLVLLAIVLGVTSWLFPKPPHRDRSDVQDVLDLRLARGEIDAHEYRRLREELARR